MATLKQLTARMQDMETEVISKNFFALLYGSYGTGKTTLISGVAKKLAGPTGKILYLDSAEGFASLDNIPTLKKNMTRLQIKDPKDLMTIADAMKSGKPGFRDFKVLLLDEVDSWFEIILHNFVRETTGTLPTEDLPEIEGKHYGPPTAAMLNIINTFKAVDGLHIIMVAHNQERGKEPKIVTSPSLPPKLMKGINEKVHVVGLVEAAISKDGYTRTVQVNPSKQVVAKTRIGGLPVKIDFKDLPKIVADWVGSSEMEKALSEPEPDPEPVDDEDVEIEEPDDLDEDDEAVEVEDED